MTRSPIELFWTAKNSRIDIAPNEGDFAKTANAWWNWTFSGKHAKCRQMSYFVSSWGRTTISSIQVFNHWLISLYTASSVKNKSHGRFSENLVWKSVRKLLQCSTPSSGWSEFWEVLGAAFHKVWLNKPALHYFTQKPMRSFVASWKKTIIRARSSGGLCLWPGHPSSPTTTSHTLCPAEII